MKPLYHTRCEAKGHCVILKEMVERCSVVVILSTNCGKWHLARRLKMLLGSSRMETVAPFVGVLGFRNNEIPWPLYWGFSF